MTPKPKTPAEARRLAELSRPEIPTEVVQLLPREESATAVLAPVKTHNRGRKLGSKNRKTILKERLLKKLDQKLAAGSSKPGKPMLSSTEAYLRQKEAAQAHAKGISLTTRDIAPLPMGIDWERRLSCQFDLGKFAKTYLPNTFSMPWARHHERCLEKLQKVFQESGQFAMAMPRSEGKTALARAAITWGTLYGYRSFPFLIAASQPKASSSLDFIKLALYSSPELQQDFPEVCYPIRRLENRFHLARGQLFNGQNTYIKWETDEIRFPILIFSREVFDYYEAHSPGFMVPVPGDPLRPDAEPRWMSKTAGTIIKTAGVDGAIRGEAEGHPILLTQPRPDVALIDDPQKDSRVDSALNCDKLSLLIDGAISFLSGPQGTIAAMMPCTVMRENDVADTYTNPELRPDWQGERHGRVISWPPGIDDEKITVDTPESMAWIEYQKIRNQSLREHGSIKLATDYYIANRKLMDNNFVCSWDERFDPKKEISAQQSAMNIRFQVGSIVFMAECQNRGRKPLGQGMVSIRKEQLREKTAGTSAYVCPVDTRSLVIQIDVQNEILFWSALAVAPDFTGVFTAYGTYPDAIIPYFRKAQTEEWSLLSKMFFEAYPNERVKAKKTDRGWRAPLEPKIYHALKGCVRMLLAKEFIRDDGFNNRISINRIGIDTRWGQVSDTIKRFCRDWSLSQRNPDPRKQDINAPEYVNRDILVPYMGQGVTGLQKQFEEYTRTRGWLFEDQVNPRAKECRWIWKPDPMGIYYLLVDVNRMKTFLFQRLASPPGAPGSVSLFNAPPDLHDLFSEHVCESEFPKLQVTTTSTGSLRKEMWIARENNFDNDWLDTAAGCMALASFNGAFLQHDDADLPRAPQIRKRLSDRWREKRQEVRTSD